MAQAPGSSSPSSSVNLCSICWEEVSDTCGRTVVRLHCSHLFHLDCIGSAFNATGIMQCPNCREIENGVWRRFDINEESDEDERYPDEMEHDENHLCHGCGRAIESSLLGIEDLTELSAQITVNSPHYGPSMMNGISTSPVVFHGHNQVHSAVPTSICGTVVGPNHTMVPSRAPLCNAGGLPNFDSFGHRAIPQSGSISNCWEGCHPAGHLLSSPPPQQQQTVRHVPFFNLNIQNYPQEAGRGDNFLRLDPSTENNPQVANPVRPHVGERLQTFQFLPDNMGSFHAP